MSFVMCKKKFDFRPDCDISPESCFFGDAKMRTRWLASTILLLSALGWGQSAMAACLTAESEPNNYDYQANTGVCSGVSIS